MKTTTRRALLAWLLAVCALAAAVCAQLPIPGKPPGFTVGHGAADAGVQIESYIDLLCPDSKAAYPALQKLAAHYEPHELRVTLVLFPLPYHQHAFTAAEAAFTLTAALGDGAFLPWLETVYANQDLFWNKATKDLSPVQVADKLRQLAKQTFPKLTDEQWDKGVTGYGGTDADALTRVSWKYACTRGASGTPLYRLNGVPFDADADWSFADWFKVVDPLVEANKPPKEEQLALSVAGAPPDRKVTLLPSARDWEALASVCADVTALYGGEEQDWARPCEFVPGRAMCCHRHEACVLRTGCVALE